MGDASERSVPGTLLGRRDGDASTMGIQGQRKLVARIVDVEKLVRTPSGCLSHVAEWAAVKFFVKFLRPTSLPPTEGGAHRTLSNAARVGKRAMERSLSRFAATEVTEPPLHHHA